MQQLSNRVMKLIKAVEDSSLPCETRNTVVRRLRLLDDALVSGRRSAAQAFAMAWARNAWSLQSARVIPPGLGSALQTQLGGMVDQIGTGWSVKPGPTRHWKPLPSCDSGVTAGESSTGVASGGGVAASSGYTPYAATDVSSDIEIIVGMLVSYVPVVGNLLYALVYLLWPAGSTTDSWSQMSSEDTYALVESRLGELKGLMTGSPGSWNTMMRDFNTDCPNWSQTPACISEANTLWTSSGGFGYMNVEFFGARSVFQDFKAGQTNPGQTTTGLNLLPLYVQYENMYLSLLRDGMLLHDHYWHDSGLDTRDLAGTSMAQELDPNYLNPDNNDLADRGVHYVDTMYNYGLGLQPSASASGWATRNQYIRNETLTALDFRDTWKYLDPRAYPAGVPGGVKLTRMIYSDLVGTPQATPHFPSNVRGPLRELSLWTQKVGEAPFVNHLYIDAVQATSPPLLGPAQSGAITGDITQPANRAQYYNLATRGPITKVEAQVMAQFYTNTTTFIGYFPRWVRLSYATGATTTTGDSVSDAPIARFTYANEVLATAQAVSGSGPSLAGSDGEADSVVFGFRYADSYDSAGEVIGVGSGKCLDVSSWTNGTPAMIRSCAQPPRSTQIWSYDAGVQQISVTNPAEWSDANPTTSGKHCLDAAGGGTAAGTQVVINACDDGAQVGTTKSSQRWSIEGVGAGVGRITNVKSGLVIDVPGNATADSTGLQLATYIGGTGQQWQVSDPSTGEIHGIGSGRCLDVPNYSTTPGTQVQIYDCGGNAAQQWTYSYNMFFYAHAPWLCLTARGGGTTAGTAVEINNCSGAAEQRWTLHGDGGMITNDKSGLALDVTGGVTDNHTLVELWTSNGTQNQQWSRTSTHGGPMYSVGAGGQCLTSSDRQLAIAPCYSPPSQAQTWTYHPVAQTFTVTSPSGPKCLDTAGGGTTAGTVVVLNVCTSEAASQRWARDISYSTITNVNSGLVLDISYAATPSGTVVVTPQARDAKGQLLPATPTQKWVWSLS